MAASIKRLVNRGTILVLALALLATLLVARPAGAQDEPPTSRDTQRVFDYAENGRGPVATFTATDTDRDSKKIFWTLGGRDASVFTIDGGVLRFKSPPDYENPASGAEGTDTATQRNAYEVTVRFGSGGQDGVAGGDAEPRYAGDDLAEIELTVNVTNVNERGSVVISSLQPQVGTPITATLTDLDTYVSGGQWQWASSPNERGAFEDIAGATNQRYQPVDADLGRYLRVTVEYVDGAGPDIKSLSAVSANPVRTDIITSNDPPKFPDQSGLGVTDGDDAPRRENTIRYVHEAAAHGTRVGAPVTAFDDTTSIDLLTYSLGGADLEYFSIDAATGQITTTTGLDADGDGPTCDANTCSVVVTARDGDDDIGIIAVAINVLMVNEPPAITRRPDPPDNNDGPTEMSHYEANRETSPALVIDADLDTTAVEAATYEATDVDADEDLSWSLEGDDESLFLIPEPDTATDPSTATLAFNGSGNFPDFEKPLDENKDNVYEVTIVVTDKAGNTDRLPVTVKVLNQLDDNQPGTVTLDDRVPEVGARLTAALTDPDTPTSDEKWQWYRTVTAATSVDAACTDRDPNVDLDSPPNHRDFEDGTPNDDGEITVGGNSWVKIPGATSKTYTPGYDTRSGGTNPLGRQGETDDNADNITETWMGGDVDVTITTVKETGLKTYEWRNFHCLMATVSYKDAVPWKPTRREATFLGSARPVKGDDFNNDAPQFQTEDGQATTRYTAKRTEAALTGTDVSDTEANYNPRLIAEAFPAVDTILWDHDSDATTDEVRREDDAANDLLTYSLSGADAKYFEITGTVDDPADVTGGALSFKMDVDLDYEDKKQYRVTITANDPSGEKHSATVTIDIANVDEPPEWVKPAMGSHKLFYAENGAAAVFEYEARTPEPRSVTYSLVTTEDDFPDHGIFTIDSNRGTLRFKASPNYEKPGDGADNGTGAAARNNEYLVRVQATATDNPEHSITLDLTVVVTDVEEAPRFSKPIDPLEIDENRDDPQKEPPASAEYLYLLNRGIGGDPTVTNLDMGAPVTAKDDDNTSTFAFTQTPDDLVDMVDGLTYALSGADVAAFHIVPATGQILILEKLDYEIKNTYSLKVTATDPGGLSDEIDITVNVINLEEVPTGTGPDDTTDPEEPTLLESHDTNKNGKIDLPEARAAVGAFTTGTITESDARAVVGLYISG